MPPALIGLILALVSLMMPFYAGYSGRPDATLLLLLAIGLGHTTWRRARLRAALRGRAGAGFSPIGNVMAVVLQIVTLCLIFFGARGIAADAVTFEVAPFGLIDGAIAIAYHVIQTGITQLGLRAVARDD